MLHHPHDSMNVTRVSCANRAVKDYLDFWRVFSVVPTDCGFQRSPKLSLQVTPDTSLSIEPWSDGMQRFVMHVSQVFRRFYGDGEVRMMGDMRPLMILAFRGAFVPSLLNY